MAEQPLCRACGKPIAKDTISFWVKPEPSEYERDTHYTKHLYGQFQAKAEVDAALRCRSNNLRVVSVGRDRLHGTGIHKFSAWDGESYRDKYFCGGTCRNAFAYALAKSTTYGLDGYWNAVKAAKAKQGAA